MFFILLDVMVIDALDISPDAKTALLVNYSAVSNIKFLCHENEVTSSSGRTSCNVNKYFHN